MCACQISWLGYLLETFMVLINIQSENFGTCLKDYWCTPLSCLLTAIGSFREVEFLQCSLLLCWALRVLIEHHWCVFLSRNKLVTCFEQLWCILVCSFTEPAGRIEVRCWWLHVAVFQGLGFCWPEEPIHQQIHGAQPQNFNWGSGSQKDGASAQCAELLGGLLVFYGSLSGMVWPQFVHCTCFSVGKGYSLDKVAINLTRHLQMHESVISVS